MEYSQLFNKSVKIELDNVINNNKKIKNKKK